jgi:hypothetical protein
MRFPVLSVKGDSCYNHTIVGDTIVGDVTVSCVRGEGKGREGKGREGGVYTYKGGLLVRREALW